MDELVYNELSNIKVGLEAIKNKTISEAEVHDLLIEVVAKIELLLKMNQAPAPPKNIFDKFKP